ncbi:D-arabinono-1,4-lactone oxidase [Corynebacterium variabile]|uniref:D-arabinono-1,4-lactone oxidase n=1 Tax=Corynebacterium variabile TaxID=1727 RepID=UPI0026496BFF|nr:D-arabinono-1,4-lactone oxidase [Corynebacterium variabile]MDN6241657.1 FAD-binding protein [Corynebacterium variabile]MDN6478265.1 FAD-binding protein [Corynebacterium variabile]MDN6675317.1 FAD-binding protein [Corynebacterium variabile]MDN6843286.1 FAD-binding protein [Corynebacterium variabile]
MTTTWHNWSRAQTAHPQAFVQPATEAELVGVVRDAAARGLHVKTVGAGHSFTPAAVTDGVLVNLDNLTGLVHVDKDAMEVTFLAGTRLRDIPGLLRPHGLALANQGDVDPQSLAGALSTSTHGTGVGFTGFAGMVQGLRIVTADGVVHDAGPGDPLFECGRVSIGALGVLTQVRMAVVDTFILSAVEKAEPLGPVVENFTALAHEVDHLEYYWFPGTSVAHVKRNTRHPLSDRDNVPGSVPRWKSVIDDELVSNAAYGAMCRVMSVAPKTTGFFNRVSAGALAQREYADVAHDVFVSKRRVRFNEMEYSVPLADAPEVLAEVHRAIDACGIPVGFPIEVRATAADDVPLSTAKGRESCYIAAHRYHRDDYREFFRVLEPILVAAGGRPHWGKHHTLGFAELSAVHEDLTTVAALRSQVDPDGMFRNPYVDRVFGLD